MPQLKSIKEFQQIKHVSFSSYTIKYTRVNTHVDHILSQTCIPVQAISQPTMISSNGVGKPALINALCWCLCQLKTFTFIRMILDIQQMLASQPLSSSSLLPLRIWGSAHIMSDSLSLPATCNAKGIDTLPPFIPALCKNHFCLLVLVPILQSNNFCLYSFQFNSGNLRGFICLCFVIRLGFLSTGGEIKYPSL